MEKNGNQNLIDKNNIGKDATLSAIIQAEKTGSTTVYHNMVAEAVALDDSWITTLEDALFSVEKIVKNPRKFIIDEELVVDVEKARRTTAKTVRHLSSNSQFVSNISEDGEVRPKKLLTTEMAEDLAIYENRFICTLVHFCVNFVEKRYNDIINHAAAFNQTGAGIDSKFNFGDNECSVKLDMKIKGEPLDKTLVERNNELIEKIQILRKRLKVLLNTEFMRVLGSSKPIHPPIMKTNLIKMNVDYNNAYKLWLFISAYTEEGFTVDYQSKTLPVSDRFYEGMSEVAALVMREMFADGYLNKEEFDKIPFESKKERKVKIDNIIKPEISFEKDKEEAADDLINEYYYKRIKNELTRAVSIKGVTNEKDMKLSFARFFRNIAKINNEMCAEIIESQMPALSKAELKPVQKKEREIQRQKQYLNKYRQLALLKREELEKALKAEAREVLKLEKLQAELDKEKGKEKTQKERKAAERKRLKAIKSKKKAAEQKAKQYELSLRQKSSEKQAEEEEKKRVKREQAQRRRDLKRLHELKEKYDE